MRLCTELNTTARIIAHFIVNKSY